MELVSQNLVVITRSWPNSVREVLVGTKQRGKFTGMTVFPGGKADATEPQPAAAAREVDEEVGIKLKPESLLYVGRLLLQDYRPGRETFGSVYVYLAEVSNDTEATATAEILPHWEPIDGQSFIDEMPPDVACWWPTVRDFDGNPKVTHIIYDEDGGLNITTKDPDFQNNPGDVFQTRSVQPQN